MASEKSNCAFQSHTLLYDPFNRNPREIARQACIQLENLLIPAMIQKWLRLHIITQSRLAVTGSKTSLLSFNNSLPAHPEELRTLTGAVFCDFPSRWLSQNLTPGILCTKVLWAFEKEGRHHQPWKAYFLLDNMLLIRPHLWWSSPFLAKLSKPPSVFMEFCFYL